MPPNKIYSKLVSVLLGLSSLCAAIPEEFVISAESGFSGSLSGDRFTYPAPVKITTESWTLNCSTGSITLIHRQVASADAGLELKFAHFIAAGQITLELKTPNGQKSVQTSLLTYDPIKDAFKLPTGEILKP